MHVDRTSLSMESHERGADQVETLGAGHPVNIPLPKDAGRELSPSTPPPPLPGDLVNTRTSAEVPGHVDGEHTERQMVGVLSGGDDDSPTDAADVSDESEPSEGVSDEGLQKGQGAEGLIGEAVREADSGSQNMFAGLSLG